MAVPIISAQMWLKWVSVHIHGHNIEALLDSEAVLNLPLSEIWRWLGIDIKKPLKKNTVVNADVSGTVGSVEWQVVLLKNQLHMGFHVIGNPPFDALYRQPTLELLQACIDLGK